MLCIGFGMAFQSFSSFFLYSFHADRYWLPIDKYIWIPFAVIVGNFSLQLITGYILVDLRKQVNLGSYQEMAYYFSGNRAFILIIGLHFTLQTIVTAGYGSNLASQILINSVINPLWRRLDTYDHDNNEIAPGAPGYYILWGIVLAVYSLTFYPFSRVQNFQKFLNLTPIIIGSMLLSYIILFVKIFYEVFTGVTPD